MNDNSIQDDTDKIEAEIVNPDEILETKELDQVHSSLLPAVTQDSSVARVDILTA